MKANPIASLANQTAIYGFGNIIIRFLSFILTPWFTRLFTTSEYGIYTEFYAYTIFFQVLLSYGLETAYFKFNSEKDNKLVYPTILSSILGSSLVFLFIILLFKDKIAFILGYENFSRFVIWFGLVNAVDAFCLIPFAQLRQSEKAFKYAGIRIVEVLTFLFFNIFFFLVYPKILCKNPDSYLYNIFNFEFRIEYVFISNVFSSFIRLALLHKNIPLFRLKFNFKLWKKILKFSLPLLIAGLAGVSNDVIDRLLLKHILPDTLNPDSQLGIYGANLKIAVIMLVFIQMFRYAAEPFYFKNTDRKDYKIIYADVTKYFIIICLFIFLGVTFSMDLFKYFIGEEFRQGIYIVPYILFSYLFYGIFFNLSIWYKLTSLTKYGALLTIIGLFVSVILNIIFVPIYGYKASAIIRMISYAIMVILSYFLSQKHLKIEYDIKGIGIYFIYVLLSYIIFQCINFKYLFLKYLIGVCFVLVLFYIVNKREKLIINLIRIFKNGS